MYTMTPPGNVLQIRLMTAYPIIAAPNYILIPEDNAVGPVVRIEQVYSDFLS